jgi:hypothetical protein
MIMIELIIIIIGLLLFGGVFLFHSYRYSGYQSMVRDYGYPMENIDNIINNSWYKVILYVGSYPLQLAAVYGFNTIIETHPEWELWVLLYTITAACLFIMYILMPLIKLLWNLFCLGLAEQLFIMVHYNYPLEYYESKSPIPRSHYNDDVEEL